MRVESGVRSPQDQVHESFTGSPFQMQSGWRDLLAKSGLFFFGIALWHNGLAVYASYFLLLAWALDSDLRQFGHTIKEPLVVAILVFCIALALGILWSDDPKSGFKICKRYFTFLFFIPYLSLMNRERLPWAIGGLLIGYFAVLLAGFYQWMFVGVQGIPPLEMSYTSFSLMLGVGVIGALYLAGISNNKQIRPLLWLLGGILLFIQFNQHGRIALLATILTSALLIVMLYKTKIRTLLVVAASLIIVVGSFAYSSGSFQERVAKAESDIALSQQGRYSTSVGYRIAMWDVGFRGIAERPVFGHGTGMAAEYFDKTVETYKGGLYKDLPEFLKTYHYHNDWIEIGMHLGAVGLVAYALLLWNWFRTLRAYQLTILGAAIVCYVFLSGLAETLVFFRQTLYLLFAITAIFISRQKTCGIASPEWKIPAQASGVH